MSFLAGSVIWSLGLDLSPLEQSIAKTGIILHEMLDAAEGIFDVFKNAFDHSLENADKLNDLSTNIGISVEALSGLGIAARQAGSGVDEIADAFKFLGKNVSEAMDGSKDAVATFQRLGVEFVDAAGNARPLEQVMMDVADAMANIPDAGDRTAAAMGLLGRSGTGLIATFSQGSNALQQQIDLAKQWGAVVSSEAAKSADAFGDMVGDFHTRWEGVQNMFGEPFRKALLPLLEQAGAWADAHLPEVQQWVGTFTTDLIDGLHEVGNWISTHQPLIHDVMDSLVFAAKDLKKTFQDIVDLADRFNNAVDKVAEFISGPKPEVTQSLRTREDALRDKAAASGAVTVNVGVVDPGASTGEIAKAIQAGARQAVANAQQANDAALKKQVLQQGGF